MKCQGQTQGSTGLCFSFSSRNADKQSPHLLQGTVSVLEILQPQTSSVFPQLLYSSMPKGKQLQENVEKLVRQETGQPPHHFFRNRNLMGLLNKPEEPLVFQNLNKQRGEESNSPLCRSPLQYYLCLFEVCVVTVWHQLVSESEKQSSTV